MWTVVGHFGELCFGSEDKVGSKSVLPHIYPALSGINMDVLILRLTFSSP
jgi:hypothetical protein